MVWVLYLQFVAACLLLHRRPPYCWMWGTYCWPCLCLIEAFDPTGCSYAWKFSVSLAFMIQHFLFFHFSFVNSSALKVREVWRAMVLGVTKSQTRISDWTATPSSIRRYYQMLLVHPADATILLLSSISTYFSYLLLRLHPSFRTSSLQRWSVGTRSPKRWSVEAPLPKSSGFLFWKYRYLEAIILKDVKCIVLLSSLTIFKYF